MSSKDVNEIISADGIEISKNQIKLEKPIKELGLYKIIASLHSDISAEIFINVARSIEEAKLQEIGEKLDKTDITKTVDEKAAINNMFDDENMAEKIGNQKEESDNSEISNDSNKQTLEDSSKVPSNNSSEDEVKISTDQK